jgi:hypothetical protein
MLAVHPLTAPLALAVPVQLLAYHVAVLKGISVDQLATSRRALQSNRKTDIAESINSADDVSVMRPSAAATRLPSGKRESA